MESRYIYRTDTTMTDNSNYPSATTAVAERPTVLHPYVVIPLGVAPVSPTPTEDTSDFRPMTPDSISDARARLIQTCLDKAKNYMSHNDPMQASEKLYKATEEAIKFLAEHYNLDEVQEAKGQGQWWKKLLGRAAKSLGRLTSKDFIDDAWTKTFDAHMLGFHENAYTVEDVKPIVPVVEKLVRYVREVNNARRQGNS
jgi:hypothetical protein